VDLWFLPKFTTKREAIVAKMVADIALMVSKKGEFVFLFKK
jgi:hypothetical protein